MQNEISRVREGGTVVTNSGNDGQRRIDAVRQIVDQKQYAKVDGYMVDLFTASAIMKVYDAINDENRSKFIDCPIQKMASIAFKLIK